MCNQVLKAHLPNLILIFLIGTFVIFMYGQIEYWNELYSNWDLIAYRAMAIASPELASDVWQPFAYRILGPYVVGLLPFPDPIAFYILAVALSIILLLIFYTFLCYMGSPKHVSCITIILFAFNKYWFGFTVWDYFRINDLISLIIIIILLWATLESKWKVYGLIFFLGTITRETALIMIPVTVAYLWEKKQISIKWKSFLVSIIPGLITFILLRILVSSSGGENLLKAFLIHWYKIMSIETWYKLFVISLLPLSFLPIIFLKVLCHSLEIKNMLSYLLL